MSVIIVVVCLLELSTHVVEITTSSFAIVSTTDDPS